MGHKMFVNLPVEDLTKSVDFFTKLGFEFDPQFTDENATCMLVGEDAYVMLPVRDFFKGFTEKEIPDTSSYSEVAVALTADSREQVDELVEKALAGGAQPIGEPTDHGFMYERSFTDLDGHGWGFFYMDMAAVPAQPS